MEEERWTVVAWVKGCGPVWLCAHTSTYKNPPRMLTASRTLQILLGVDPFRESE